MREGHAGYIMPTKDFPDCEDVTALIGAEVDIRHDGQVIWISVDGVTRLRIIRNPLLTEFAIRGMPDQIKKVTK